jgi:hypothetical protein
LKTEENFKMAKTYTYTARQATQPEQLITFTLYQNHLMIEPDRLEQTAASTAADLTALAQSDAWSKIFAVLKSSTKPHLDLADVDAGLEKDCLRLMGWLRSSDRRWLPMTLGMEHVDNPEAARTFVKELNRRKMSLQRHTRFAEWLNAKAYWFLAGSCAALAAMISFKSKRS